MAGRQALALLVGVRILLSQKAGCNIVEKAIAATGLHPSAS